MVLSGSLWYSIVSVCGPMAVFQLINQMFRVFDLSITCHISTKAVAAVSFFSQLSSTFSAIGGGLAIGVGIIIAGEYGGGNYNQVKKLVNSSFALALILSVLLSASLIILEPVIFLAANTPPDLIQMGRSYYRVEMIGLVFCFINSVYIALEKARGNGRVILWLNLVMAIIKISLNALFVLVFHFGITMISIATLLANLVVTWVGLYRLRNKKDVFGLSFSYIDLRWKSIKPIIMISIPVMAEKVAFSAGKTMVNSIGVSYGTEIVGALGISNSISSLSTMPPSSIGDGGSAVIRQNIGNSNEDRSLKAFRCILLINLAIGILGLVLTIVFLNPLINTFTNGDTAFSKLVKNIFVLEMISNVFLAVNSSVMGLLYGFGYTKLSFLLNFARLFLFRLPTLIFLQKCTDIPGSTVMGIVMMVSNGLTGIFSIITACLVIYKQFGKRGFQILLQP